jgi:hypothetical protein
MLKPFGTTVCGSSETTGGETGVKNTIAPNPPLARTNVS